MTPYKYTDSLFLVETSRDRPDAKSRCIGDKMQELHGFGIRPAVNGGERVKEHRQKTDEDRIDIAQRRGQTQADKLEHHVTRMSRIDLAVPQYEDKKQAMASDVKRRRSRFPNGRKPTNRGSPRGRCVLCKWV